MSTTALSEWRGTFRYRLVACFAVGLALQAALGSAALASTTPVPGADRSPPEHSAAPSSAKAAVLPAKENVAGPADSVPELWTPRAAAIADTNTPVGAESLFDGDATTGVTADEGETVAVRLELGSVREVLGLGVHGSGRAKLTIYAEDKGARRLISTVGDSAVNLQSDHWAQVRPAASTKTSVLVVQWTASSAAPAGVGELALWVAGRSRQALAEAAIADRLVTELPENAVAASAVPWSATVARVTAQGSVSARFDVKLTSEPRLGRAFLVYEVEKKAHWTGVARSINGHVVRGGYRSEARGTGGVQVEEINPAWLRSGDNKIAFEPTLTEAAHGYSIKNVRLVSVPRGIDAAPAPGARTPLSDGDLATGVGGPGVHVASVRALADREPAFLSFYLDKPTAGTLTVSAEGGPAKAQRKGQVSVDLNGRQAGWQTVPVGGVLPKTSELRLRVQGGRDSTGQVSEARVQGFPALTWPADLAVSYPLHGECLDHKTYVRGFVSEPGRLQKPQLFVDGQPVLGMVDPDGSFEANVQEPAAAKGKPWSIRLEVATGDGGRRTRTVPVDTCVEPPKGRIIGVSPPVEDVGAPYGAVVSPQKASTLEFAGAKIEIPAGAVDSDVRVTMRALDRGQVRPVESEMDNVTTSGGALRFGPHGLTFKKPVTVTVPIDAAQMPPGMTSGDVVAFFFDEATAKWTPLPKVVSRSDRVVAQTTHFTDFIASTVKTPDHPDLQHFNPNTMKDVKVGEPGAGITVIQPPEANSKGTANLSYPIETPPPRNGVGPQLALTYDSDRVTSNGWLGVGWTLALSSIEIDTRFGVPKYDGINDIYSLDGALLKVTTGGKYVKRVEGSFSVITRQGPTGPGTGDATSYWWTVTDKNGTVYTYGSTNCGTTAAPVNCNSRLASPRSGPKNIFRWYLEKVKDTFGNVMTIKYQHDAFVMPGSSPAENADAVYPVAIDYTSNETVSPALAANYHVVFTWDTLPPPPTTPPAPTRPDITITGRPGFLEVTQRRLTDIHVKMGTGTPATWSTIRHYRLEYLSNLADTLQKSVLSAVALWSSDFDTSELFRHTFEYNKAPDPTAMFDTQKTWGQVSQDGPSGYVPRTDNALSHSTDNLAGGAITLGIGFPYFSVTGSFGADLGSSVTDLSFLGLTGQGLPDQLDVNGTLSLNDVFHKQSTASTHFSPTGVGGLAAASSLGATDRSGWTAGGNVSGMNGAFGGGLSYARHVQNEFSIITDMNGDGFPDRAYQSGSSVLVDQNDGNRNFTSKTWNNYSLASSQFTTAMRVAEAGQTSGFFKTDPMLRWTAPFTGPVTINADATKRGGGGDDLRVELYIATDSLVRFATFGPSEGGVNKLIATNVKRTIVAGDRIYMRVQAMNDGVSALGAIVSLSISYDAAPSGYFVPPGVQLSTLLDPTGSPMFNFDNTPDHRLAGGPRTSWHLTATGKIRVGRCFTKLNTSDEVTATYTLRNKDGTLAMGYPKLLKMPARVANPTTGSSYCFPTTGTGSFPSTGIIDVTVDQSMALTLTSDSPVDPDRVGGGSMEYTWYCRPTVSHWIQGQDQCGTPQQVGSGFDDPYTITPTDPWPKVPIPYSDIKTDHREAYFQTAVWKVFNNNNTATPAPFRRVAAPSASVTFAGSVTTKAALTEDVVVLVQGVNKLFAKKRIPAGTPNNTTFQVNTLDCAANADCPSPRTCNLTTKLCSTGVTTVTSGEPVFFTIYSPTVVGGNVDWTPTMNNVAPSANCPATPPASNAYCNVNKAIADDKFDNTPRPNLATRDPMSGGFRHWFQGDLNDSLLPFDPNIHTNLIDRMATPPQGADLVMGLTAAQLDPDAPDLWGRGGARIIETDTMIPGRVNNTNATQSNASRMSALRVSDTWNLNLSTHAFGGSAGLNAGDATTQVDFLDFNGDRFPDSITQGGVLLNNGVDGFASTRDGVDWQTQGATGASSEIRRIMNVSLQAGTTVDSSGSRMLINEAKGDGETQKISTTASLSGSADYGVSSTRIDLVDVNGDGLPDHVRQEPTEGKLRVRLNLGKDFSNEVPWTTTEWSGTQANAEALPAQWDDLKRLLGPGASATSFILNNIPGLAGSPASTNVVRLQDTGTLSAQVGGSVGGFISGGGGPTYSVTRTWADLIDVNGDGLPDQVVKVPGDPVLHVKLNKGNGFAADQPWTLPPWIASTNVDYSFLIPDGVGFSTVEGWGKNVSFQVCWILCVGASGFESKSSGGPSAQFEDIDGDGDLDQVMKVPGDANVYAKFNKVVSTDETAPSKLGPPNLLRVVNRPLGGRITIAYARSGNHVDLTASPKLSMPSNQWAMSSVVVDSGTLNGTVQGWSAQTTQTFDYSEFLGYGSGYFDPVERENYGYQYVRTRFPGEDVTTTSILHTHHNQNYYLKGLEIAETSYQAEGANVIQRSTFNTYEDPSGKDPTTQTPRFGTIFPAPKTSTTYFYEASSDPVTHVVTKTFNTNGDLTDVVDVGQVELADGADDFNYHIDYQSIVNTNWTAKVPSAITVRTGQVAGAGTLLGKRTAAFTTQPKPNSVTNVIAGGRNPSNGTIRTETSPASATWTFTYDSYGNVKTATSPVNTQSPTSTNHKLDYTYEPTAQTYPITTKQIDPANPSAEYIATAVYDLKFGRPTRIIDIAGGRQEIDYDPYGRITKVWAPNDFNTSGTRMPSSTIAISYSQFSDTTESARPVPAWAMVTHRSKAPGEGSVPGDPPTTKLLRTVNFVDGLNRSIQVKKDITRDDGSGTTTASMSVSGQTAFDARGRVYRQGQPMFTDASVPTSFVTVPMTNPKEFAYDVLGRQRKEQHPDGVATATTTTSYQTGVSPKDGGLYRVKLTTDPLNGQDAQYHYRTEYVSVRDELRLLAERNRINGTPTDVYTAYEYDPLGRVTKITDAKENVTTAEYDTVGNLFAVQTLDAGRREFWYCEGGYVCSEQSSNQRDVSFTTRTRYTYDHDRLKTITYSNPSTNPGVTYVYGTATQTGTINTDGGTNYKANRVTQRVDEAGAFDYNYDALGNIISETATLKDQMGTQANCPTPPQPSPPPTPPIKCYAPFTTSYKWDNFGRLIDVTFPGTAPTEIIRYGYDAGGAVTSAWGRVGTGTPSAYVKHVGYNEFGERTRIQYGNDVFSKYAYAADTRRLTDADTTLSVGPPAVLTQKLRYSYDLIGSVTSRAQNLPWDPILTNPVPIGGVSNMSYHYDPLNQLTSADLNYRGKVTDGWYASVNLSYDTIGNITSKIQSDNKEEFDTDGEILNDFPVQATTYTLTPNYPGRPHAPRTVTEDRSGVIATRDLAYDDDGNVISSTINGTGRYLTWTDTDRIRSMCNGTETNCAPLAQALYSADGTRTHNKVTPPNQSTTETLYVNQYLTVRNGTLPTKHVYLGDQRIASKVEGSGQPKTYWYHSDNIHSTQYVTDASKALVQHLEYFPGGEIWRGDEKDATKLVTEIARATTFTGKEFDAAAGYYYMSARYYEPQMQMWLSPDPILAKYMKGEPNRGVFAPKNLALYTYTWNNPVVIIDPDGREPVRATAGTAAQARAALDNSPTRVGQRRGNAASAALIRMGQTDDKMVPQNAGNVYGERSGNTRYVYTERGGWIDMEHFIFYAGMAQEKRVMGTDAPFAESVAQGRMQELNDSSSSRFSYEDLPSDAAGAAFGSRVFDARSPRTLGEQVESFLNGLGANTPQSAPNWRWIPNTEADVVRQGRPTVTNETTTPLFTRPQR